MRYEELTDEELQAKATEAGVEDAGSLTRDQLVVHLAEKEYEERSLSNRGDFVTPRTEQGEELAGADEEPRNVGGYDEPQTGEIAPSEDETADQAGLGGTGGTTTGGLGATGGNR